jgi:hypothetical protein
MARIKANPVPDYQRSVWDSITQKWIPQDERIARIIARKLGHNDDLGIHWESYILAARGLIDELYIMVPGPKDSKFKP